MKSIERTLRNSFIAIILLLAATSQAYAQDMDIKWNRPPDMRYGVNLQSTFTEGGNPTLYERWVADDWQCRDQRPVTGVHFWGSYIGWRDQAEIDETVTPPGVEAFMIRIYSDVPAGTDPEFRASHPDDLLYEAKVADFSESFVASIPHADDAGNIRYEHKFSYDLDLPEPFKQEQGTIYWISISAIMPEGAQFPWG